MAKSVLHRIERGMPTFSKGQKRIGEYILKNSDKAAFMTASKLGKLSGVSESTVVRFASELGYDGYPGMQRALQEIIRSRLTSTQRIQAADDQFGSQDVLSAVIQSDMEKLRMMAEEADRTEFSKAVDLILGARHLYILGVRSVAPLANFLGYYLNYMFNNVHVISGFSAGEMFEKIVSVNSEDVIIAFSFPRYSAPTAKGARYCRSAGATVIGITDSKLSPLGQCSDHVLVAKSDMVSLVDSLVAPLSLVNALIVAVAAKREKELSQTFANLERIWDEYDVYEKQAER